MKPEIKFSGKKLKALREKLSLSIHEVLNQIRNMGFPDLSYTTYKKWEEEISQPRYDHALAIGRVFKKTLEYFNQ